VTVNAPQCSLSASLDMHGDLVEERPTANWTLEDLATNTYIVHMQIYRNVHTGNLLGIHCISSDL